MVRDSKNAYDIDISELYSFLKRYCSHNVVARSDEHIEGFRYSIECYCRKYHIPFDKEPGTQFLIIPPSIYEYANFLSRALAYIDIAKINLFLEYQASIYSQNPFLVNFPTLLEHTAYSQVKWMSLYKTDDRLYRILGWVEKKHQLKPKQSGNLNTVLFLKWKGNENQLKGISKELKTKGFTKNPTDFEKVFTSQIATEWLKNPEYLAYLLEKLYNHTTRQFIASKGGKFKVAQMLFYENVENSRNYFNLSNLLYNTTTRQATKHRQLRDRVDKLISEFIK